jgi:pentalenene oxygenase
VQRQLGNRPVGFDDLAQLPLTDRVVRETLRLYPATWFSDRVCAAPAELGRYRIPAQTAIVFSNRLLHRDPRSFAEPERFDPERFLPERAASIPDGAYLPFGAGVHMCIGTSFALAEARIILAAMVHRFTVRAVPRFPVVPRPGVTLAMRHPFAVVPTLRRTGTTAHVGAPALT